MKIGINIDDKEMKKDPGFYIPFLSRLEKYYPRIEAVEITYSSFKWAKHFEKNKEHEAADILSDFPFEYSIHFDKLLELLLKDPFKCKQELSQCLEFCQKIKCTRLSIHCLNQSIAPEKFNKKFYHDTKRELIDRQQVSIEKEFLLAILNILHGSQLTLLIENILPKINTSYYSYAINPKLMIAQIESIGTEKVQMCFDWGHAYIASKYLHWNFEEVVKELIPFANQMHVHSNYGHSFNHIHAKTNHIIHQHADFHLPLYEGKIPYSSLFYLLNNYKGLFLLEYTFSHCGQLWESITQSLDFINSLRASIDITKTTG